MSQLTIEDLLPQLSWHVQEKFGELTWRTKLRHVVNTFRIVLGYRIRLDRVEKVATPKDGVLFFQSLCRPDYDELMKNLRASPRRATGFVSFNAQDVWSNKPQLFERESVFRACGKAGGFTVALWTHRRLIRVAIRKYGVMNSIWLLLQWAKLHPFLSRVLAPAPRAVVVFAEMQDVDRVLSRQCKQRGIPCATLQHGLYAEYTRTETVNQYNYQPRFVSNFLAWGDVTSELVRRYSPHVQVHICGKPTHKTLSASSEPAKYACVVIFDQKIFRDENREMLERVREAFADASLPLGVRFHPQNDHAAYDLDGFEETGSGDWMHAECYIGHTTTFLLDLVSAGYRLYRYDSGAETVFEDSRIEFKTADELSTLHRKPYPDAGEVSGKFIAWTGDAAIQAHWDVLSTLSRE